MSKKQLEIIFNRFGDMIPLAQSWYTGNGSVTRLAEDFDETLVFHKMFEYKTARAYFRGQRTGIFYCMFLDDFDTILRLGYLVNNEVSGRFKFTKRGQGQGIKLILSSVDEARLKDMRDEQRKDERTRWF